MFAVVIYRMAISTLVYQLISNFPGGPSIADLAVSITGACLQLVAIQVMNFIYEYLAVWLTKWGENNDTSLSQGNKFYLNF